MAKKLTLDQMYAAGQKQAALDAKAAADKKIADAKAAADKKVADAIKAENDAIIAEARKTTPWMVPFLTGEHAATFLKWAKDTKANKAPTTEQIAQETYTWPETQDWSANQLKMYNLSFTNPGQYKDQIAQKTMLVDDYIAKKGVELDAATRDALISDVAIKGWDITDARLNKVVAASFDLAKTLKGDALAIANNLTSNAQNYLVNFSPAKLAQLAKDVLAGDKTYADVSQEFKSVSIEKFPFMAKYLNADPARLPVNYFSQSASTIANTLNIPVSSIDFTDPKWLDLVTKKGTDGKLTEVSQDQLKTAIKADPALGYKDLTSTKEQLKAYVEGITDIVKQKGLETQFGSKQIEDLAQKSIDNNWALSAPEIKNIIGGSIDIKKALTGEALTISKALKSDAANYLVTLSDGELVDLAKGISSGTKTYDDAAEVFKTAALQKFPFIEKYLSANPNATVASYFAQSIRTISNTLGVPEASIDLNDPKWAKLAFTTGADGKVTELTQDQIDSTIKADPTYNYYGLKSTQAKLAPFVSQINYAIQTAGLKAKFTPDQIQELAKKALENNWSSLEIKDEVGKSFGTTPAVVSSDAATGVTGATGTTGATPAAATVGTPSATLANDIKALADKYLVKLTPEQMTAMGTDITQGNSSLADQESILKTKAAALYPFMASTINTVSPKDYFAKTANTIANTLDIPLASINLNDPKWAGLLSTKDAQGNAIPFTNDQIIAILKTDPSYKALKSTTDSLTLATNIIDTEIAKQGVTKNITPEQRQKLIDTAVDQGWSSADQRLTQAVGAFFTSTDLAAGSSNANIVADLKTLASQYMIPMSDESLKEFGANIAKGTSTVANMEAWFKDQAKSLYPFMAGTIDTIRPDTWFYPLKQLIATNLEVPVNTVDFTEASGKWMNLATKRDPATGANVARSNSEAITEMRKNPIYGYDKTQGAMAAGFDIAKQIRSMMGFGAV